MLICAFTFDCPEAFALWIVSEFLTCLFIITIIAQMKQQKVLKYYDPAQDAPLHGPMVRQKLVQGFQKALSVLAETYSNNLLDHFFTLPYRIPFTGARNYGRK